MFRRKAFGIMFSTLMICSLILISDYQICSASGTVYIRADGSIDPVSANLSSFDNVTYVFTNSISDHIIVQRNNIIIDGKGFELHGSGIGDGFSLVGVSNVAIMSTRVSGFQNGIYLEMASGNRIYYNDFVGNVRNAYISNSDSNVWDNGYPSGGNYWSDYFGTDIYLGPDQNDVGPDGIGDQPYFIDANNIDVYPSMRSNLRATRISLNPSQITAQVGETFTVDVNIEKVIDAFAYEFKLAWNYTVISLQSAVRPAGHFLEPLLDPGNAFVPVWKINLTRDATNQTAHFGYTLLAPENVRTGSGALIELAFKVLAIGETTIALTNSKLPDESEMPIPHTIANGYFLNGVPYHDLAVIDVRLSKDTVRWGEIVGVQVDVENNGNVPESFSVTVCADTSTAMIGDELIIGVQSSWLPPKSSVSTMNFWWDTSSAPPGNLITSAFAQADPDDNNMSNNLFINGAINFLPSVRNLAVLYIWPRESAAHIGDLAQVEVAIQDQGSTAETAFVRIYADLNTEVIGDEVVIGNATTSLNAFSSRTLVFLWNTTGLAAGNYTISAAIDPLPEEAELQDNNMTRGILQLFESIPCTEIIIITCPANVTFNPSIFKFNYTIRALQVPIGNLTIDSTGYEGLLRVLGYTNGTVHLRVDQPSSEYAEYNLPLNGRLDVPLWIVFDPGTYSGTFELDLTISGVHRVRITVNIVHIWVCSNGCYVVKGGTASFEWPLTGGSLVYLEVETDLPPGWTYTVDPPIGTFFETPHDIIVNITASPDAKEGETGLVTLRAYKNATGAMIWQFIYFASTDNKPPTIESLETPIMTPDGHLAFNATVRDPSGIAEVLLHYSVDGGPWQNTTMQWSSGDTFNSTQYTLTEFLGTDADTIEYCVSAIDWLGNETSSSPQTISIVRDIAVTDFSYVRLGGYRVALNITVTNQGTLPLSFLNLALYDNSTLITLQPIFLLQNETSTVLSFSLNLSEGSHIITACVPCLPNEANVANNAMHLAEIIRVLAGDIAPDYGTVDIFDVVTVALAFSSQPGDSNWNPVADINNDNIVDIFDLVVVALHFGETS